MGMLVILAAGVAVLLAVALTDGPPSPARVAAFESSQRLTLDDAGRAYLRAYLRDTRRSRVLGVVVIALAVVLFGVSTSTYRFDVDISLCGWLGGAIWAELRLATRNKDGQTPDRRFAQRWLIVLPYLVVAVSILLGAALAAASTGRSSDGAILRWTLFSVAVALSCAYAVARIEHRRGPADLDQRIVDAEIRVRSVAAVTAISTVISILFMLRGYHAAGSTGFGVLAGSRIGIDTIWFIGAIVIGWIVAQSGLATGRDAGHGRVGRPAVQVGAIGGVLVLLSAGWLVRTWVYDRAPYSPSAARPVATVRFTDNEHLAADAAALGVSVRPILAGKNDALVVGRIDVRVPRTVAGTYDIILIDRVTNTAVRVISDDQGSAGWDGRLDVLSERYPWLAPVAPTRVDDGSYTESAMAVMVDVKAGLAPFVALVPDRRGMTADELLIAMVFVGTDGQIFWATPVPIAN